MTIIHTPAVPEPDAPCNPLAPPVAEQALALAYQALDAGDSAQAEAQFRHACALAPTDAECAAAYGLFMHDQARHAAALPFLLQALATYPARIDLVSAYVTTCLTLQQPALAEQALRTALALKPNIPALMRDLAELCFAANNMPEAIELADEAAALQPAPAAFVRHHAQWLMTAGQERRAITLLDQHCHQAQNDAFSWQLLAQFWQKVQEPQKAALAWRHYQNLQPDAPDWPDNQNMEPELNLAYIRALFDGYAAHFDTDLQSKLRYQAPALIAKTVEALRQQGRLPRLEAGFRLLDLGCGTGLGARAFVAHRPHCTGVDLSAGMIAEAEKTGLYQQLIIGDVVAACAKLEPGFPLIIAADVLVYLGDLALLFAAVNRLLPTGGCFAATVEDNGGVADWLLQPQRRYAHSADYLQRLSSTHKWQVLSLAPCTPRYEKNQPVSGRLLVAQSI